MTFRSWLSVATLVLIGVIVYFSRHELHRAWILLEHVNIWILLLLIPGQIFVYLAGGEMMFSYLRAKKSIGHITPLGLARLALELNFVNHVLPSAGVSGISYMGWRLGQLGVSSGRATMSQLVRYVMGLAAFVTLLAIAVLVVTVDGSINRSIILVSILLAGGILFTMISLIFLLSNSRRIDAFTSWLTKKANWLGRKVTFGRKSRLVHYQKIKKFFNELHEDFMALRADKKLLIKPYLWGLAYTAGDVALFSIAFIALGESVNPAPILIAYGVAAMAGFFVATPGGAGAYEAIMVAFLAAAGVSQGAAIAGILLARVILLLGTIIFGYIFYQHALIKYGKRKLPKLPEV